VYRGNLLILSELGYEIVLISSTEKLKVGSQTKKLRVSVSVMALAMRLLRK
jgi:hypothetical protein